MILVICGAGASYDSVATLPAYDDTFRSQTPSRPPLASELFFIPNNRIVKEAIKRFPRYYDILPYLQMIPEGQAVETKLEELQNEAESDTLRIQQIAAIQYYLQYLIFTFEAHWEDVHDGPTNYRPLIDQLRRANELVCIVTFNYDCMIEKALLGSVGIRTDSLSEYIADEKFKFFKLHGSVNWVKRITAPFSTVDPQRDHTELINELIDSAPLIETSEDFMISAVCPAGRINDIPIWPAIAIPVTTKRMFECPAEHLSALLQLLPETERIVTIGWRGAEGNFLQLSSKLVAHRTVPVLPIAKDEAGAEAVMSRLRDNRISAIHFPSPQGFSKAIVSRSIEEFCCK